MRILVVEDERDLNRIICKRLAAAGYSTDACYDGARRSIISKARTTTPPSST